MKFSLLMVCLVSIWSSLVMSSVFATDEAVLDEPRNMQQVYVEYPEFEPSVTHLESVRVVGPQEMTYCSLITKMNLQRFTGLPATTTVGEEHAILQGDAIRLIEEGLSEQAFLPLDRLSKDMDTYFPDRLPYALFDMYIYTPAPDEFITEKQYLFQGHRVVLLSVEDHRRVMDPLRGTTSSWQSWDIYKQYIDSTAYMFVYNQAYAFEDRYVFDLEVDDLAKSEREVEDLTSMLYKGIVVPELDETFMPVASKFLSTITLFSPHFSVSFPGGVFITADDGSPFNIGLLTTQMGRDNETGSIDISLPGKHLLFSAPAKVSFSREEFSSSHVGTSYRITKETDSLSAEGCNDGFDEQGQTSIVADGKEVVFTICHTGRYSIVHLPQEDRENRS